MCQGIAQIMCQYMCARTHSLHKIFVGTNTTPQGQTGCLWGRCFLPKFGYFRRPCHSPFYEYENIIHRYQIRLPFMLCEHSCCAIAFFQSFPIRFYISIWCCHELLVLFCSLRLQCTTHVLDSAATVFVSLSGYRVLGVLHCPLAGRRKKK